MSANEQKTNPIINNDRNNKNFLKACEEGDIEQVKELLQSESINVNYENGGFTPLHSICSQKKITEKHIG